MNQVREIILRVIKNHKNITVALLRHDICDNHGCGDELNHALGFKTYRKQTSMIKSELDKMVTEGILERFIGLGHNGKEARVYELNQ